jgi:FkbM family methyltransferase
MRKSDRLRLSFTRNWSLPGKFRLLKWLNLSNKITTDFKNGITWLKNENLAIYINVDNYIEHLILSTGDYEEDVYKLINISLKPGYVAIDVGANIGIQTIRMSSIVGDYGKVYSFEPIEFLRKKFQNNVALNNCENVELLPLALSDENHTIEVYIDEKKWNQGTFSLSDSDSVGTRQQLTVMKGDDIPQINLLERLDLIKIDVEGFEYNVLRGLRKTLNKHHPRIIFEYDASYWKKSSGNLNNCIEFLTELNYITYHVTSAGCELIIDPQDVLAENLFSVPIRKQL